MPSVCVGRKQYDEETVLEIIEAYKSGTPIISLVNKHRIAGKTILKFLFKYDIHIRGLKESLNISMAHLKARTSRRKLNPTERQMFCNEYVTRGESVANMAKKFNLSKGVARKILKQEGIFREPAFRSYELDTGFFKVIESPEKAYWFGFILADGCVFNGRSPGLRVKLQELDLEHLFALRAALKSNHPVKKIRAKYSHNGKNLVSVLGSLDIRNAEMVEDLSRHGCIPNKTNIEASISGIPDDLFRHFARGYFDGDGSIIFTERKNRVTKNGYLYVESSWTCVGSLSIMVYLRNKLCSMLACEIPDLKSRRGCWCLHLSGVRKVQSLFEFLYGCDGPFLPRKKLKWEEGNVLIQRNYKPIVNVTGTK